MIFEFFQGFNFTWQALSVIVGAVGAVLSVPKVISIMHKKRVQTFNNNLKNSEEFQNLKEKVEDYSVRTTKNEGEIHTLTVKLDQFIDNNKHWQDDISQTLRQNTDETREIARYIRDHISKDKKKSWF